MRVSKDKFDLNAGAMSLLRIHYGIILLAHGWLKIFVFTLEGTAAYFSSIGLSPMFAYFVSVGELVGGIALILGVQTRLAAFLSIPIVFGAAVVSIDNGWLHSANGGGWEYAASLTVIAIVIAMSGPKAAFGLNIHPLNSILPKFIRD